MDDETQGEPPLGREGKPRRRTRWMTGGAVVAVTIVSVGAAVAFSRKSVPVPVAQDVGGPDLAAKPVRRPLDHQVSVRQHVRRQPYGRDRSQRKEIIIAEHFRGPKAA